MCPPILDKFFNLIQNNFSNFGLPKLFESYGSDTCFSISELFYASFTRCRKVENVNKAGEKSSKNLQIEQD